MKKRITIPDCATKGQKRAQLLRLGHVRFDGNVSSSLLLMLGCDKSDLEGRDFLMMTFQGMDKMLPFVWLLPWSNMSYEYHTESVGDIYTIERPENY